MDDIGGVFFLNRELQEELANRLSFMAVGLVTTKQALKLSRNLHQQRNNIQIINNTLTEFSECDYDKTEKLEAGSF